MRTVFSFRHQLTLRCDSSNTHIPQPDLPKTSGSQCRIRRDQWLWCRIHGRRSRNSSCRHTTIVSLRFFRPLETRRQGSGHMQMDFGAGAKSPGRMQPRAPTEQRNIARQACAQRGSYLGRRRSAKRGHRWTYENMARR